MLGTATLSGGQGSPTTTGLGVGAHAVAAVYGGDNNFTATVLTGVAVTVNSPDFTLTGTSGALTVIPGSLTTFILDGGLDIDWKRHIAIRAVEASYVRMAATFKRLQTWS